MFNFPPNAFFISLFFSVHIIFSSYISHELKFKYPSQSAEGQDIMEVKLLANKHSILYLPLARKQNVTTVWLRQPKRVDVLLLSWCTWCLVFMLQGFSSSFGLLCLLRRSSQIIVNRTQHTQWEREKLWSSVAWTRSVHASQLMRSMNGSIRFCT